MIWVNFSRRQAVTRSQQIEKNKCHQVKRKNYHRIEIKVSFDRKYVSTSRKYVSTSRKSAATNRKNVSTDRKNTYQPVEKKVATERKQKSANWTKKGIIRSKWKIRLVVPILLRKFPTDRRIFFRSNDTLFRSADTSTRWHFDSKTLLPEKTSTRWVSTILSRTPPASNPAYPPLTVFIYQLHGIASYLTENR